MVKTIELVVVATLLIFAFFAGVKYSDSVKNHASWLFETKEEEVELPDLSNETTTETTVTADGTTETTETAAPNQAAVPQDSAPMDNLDNNPQPQAAPSRH